MLSIVITILDTTRNNRSFNCKVRIIREYKYLQILIHKNKRNFVILSIINKKIISYLGKSVIFIYIYNRMKTYIHYLFLHTHTHTHTHTE